MLDPVALGGACQRDQRNASQRCRDPQRFATSRNSLATRLQRASRGIDTLNGRSATRRPEEEKNQMHCTEDIVLHRRMRLRQCVHSNGDAHRARYSVARSPSTEFAFACACACALRFTCASTCSRRVVGCVRMSIHKYACAHTYTCPMSTTQPESAKLTTPPTSAISPHKNGRTHPAQTK